MGQAVKALGACRTHAREMVFGAIIHLCAGFSCDEPPGKLQTCRILPREIGLNPDIAIFGVGMKLANIFMGFRRKESQGRSAALDITF